MAEHTPAPTAGRAVYGFALFLLFHSFFIIYVVWVLVPTGILEDKLGLSYLPDKYFSLYVPVLILCGVTIFAFFIYPSLNLAMTPDVDDSTTICDKYSIYRCEFLDTSHTRCNNEVKVDRVDSWLIPKYCHIHKSINNEHGSEIMHEELISNFCDCPEGRFCLLRENPSHLNSLRTKTKIPTVSDLDLAEMCHQVFGE